MVTGTQWPTGDPFLERQNEPSMAVSSRNPMHVVAGDNDYRTVDLPGVPCPTNTTAPCKPTGDAWLGFFSSTDGGNTWTSTLVPGYPQDTSSIGTASVLHGYAAAADPYIRPGTNGMFYYSGLVFNRDSSGSAVFLARYADGNNNAGGSAASYIDTHIIASGGSNNFLDKPAIAVDIPRGGGTCSIPGSADGSVPASNIPAGNIYIAYTQFNGPESSNISAIMFSHSTDCGATWSSPVQISKTVGTQQTNQGAALAIDPKSGNVYIVWRIFASSGQSNALAGVAYQVGSKTFTPIVNKSINPFDQGTTGASFRTNAYPSIAVDNNSIAYVAWSQRGVGSGGDARIQVLTAKPSSNSAGQITGVQFGGPVTVDNYSGRGHQIMPALAFSSANLTVAWYDFRDDDEVAVYTATGSGLYSESEELPSGVTPVFSTYVADPTPTNGSSTPPVYSSNARRHTVDIRAARAASNLNPKFKPSIMVSQYAFGSPAPDPSTADSLPGDADDIQQLDFDAPNLPMFQTGTVPFVGDYIDVAGPTFVSTNGSWRFNSLGSDPDYTHIVWTDNRNVVQPADGNWANYTPVGVEGSSSIFEPGSQAPSCLVGQTGMRNQDIYTATLSSGLLLGSKGNTTQGNTGTTEYPVTIGNPTSQTVYYLLTIQNQPTSGTASFLQYPIANQTPSTLTTVKVGVAPYSSASRSVFISSSNASPNVSVSAVQTTASYSPMSGGLTSTTSLNADPSTPANPNISNVEIFNPNISNPNISNPNISNPNISNPNISNPNISNVTFANPNISNPNISNPNISNPNISNPNISNPNISNPNISNTAISDTNYTISNTGNTSAAYSLLLVQGQPLPQGVTVQLIVSGVYLTPVANGCNLAVQANYTPVLNIANPTFVKPSSQLPNATTLDPSTPTFSLQPGEQALVTLRAYYPATLSGGYNAAQSITPVVSSQAVTTSLSSPPPQAPTILTVAPQAVQAIVNGQLNQQLTASGGTAPYSWTLVSGTLPSGVTLSPAGLLSGAPVGSGTYNDVVQVSDASGQTTQGTVTLTVALPSLTIASATLPSGQFNAPYLGPALSARGGTGSYTWSLGPGGALPTGIGIDSQSGTLSGTPAQAGVWNIPVTVTDSNGSTATASFPLTVGLATGQTAGSGCMPYPATPLYPSGATWTIGASLPNSQMTLMAGNVLTGCLSSADAASYPTMLTASVNGSVSNFNLNVIGQNPVYASLPPTSTNYQQGVVAPGQSFSFSPVNASSSGNYLSALTGGRAIACTSATTGQLSLTATQPGRYDILFDTTTQDCSSVQSFPTSPAPIIIGSVDAIASSVRFEGDTVSVSSLTSGSNTSASNVIEIPYSTSFTGSTIPVTISVASAFDSNYSNDGCTGSGCLIQTEIGLNTDAAPQGCTANGGPGYSTGTTPSTITINVPNVPGRYYVAMDRSLNFSCLSPDTGWWSGAPSASRYIGIVDVGK